MTIGIDASLLLSIYQSRLSALGAGQNSTTGDSTIAKPVAPTAPWIRQLTAGQKTAGVQSAMAGAQFVDESAAKLDLAGASQDYKKLFALYNGLNTLENVGSQINGKNLASSEVKQINATFQRGLSEIVGYVSTASFDKLRLTLGDVASSDATKLSVPKASVSYVTPPLASSSSTEVPAFTGNVAFNISIKRASTTVSVPIDLSQMGAQPRTIGNVVSFINSQLQGSGFDTRVASVRQPGAARTITSGGQTITLPPASDQWALGVNVGTSEVVTFQAPSTAGAVYVAQTVGDPDPDKNPTTNDSHVQQQLLKFQTDTIAVNAPLHAPGQANWVDDRSFANTLGPTVGTVHATQVGPDGSVYLLADVSGTVNGQTIKGAQDVALMKYDSAGKLLYTRTLGAASSAAGLGLAISASGQIAVAGSVSGGLSGSTDGPLNSGTTGAYAGKSDSFVSLYDSSGNETWTERRGSRQEDSASQVAFGADGTVYVAGRTQQALPGTTAIGGWDGYIEAFKTDSTGKPQTVFTQTLGSAGNDRPAGLVVDGSSLVTASVEDGRAVLRRFDVSSGTPSLTSTRDLGDLQGGDVVGLALDGGQVVLAGNTANASFSGANVTRAGAGGTDAFALRLSADLTVGSADNIAFYGGTGNDRANSLAVGNGQVWLGGSAGSDLPGQPAVGTKDGFLVNLNVDAGTIDWSRRFTGKDSQATPTAIAVAPTGASVLDRIGLPNGALDLSASPQISAVSSLRPGDQFTIKTDGGPWTTVTLEQAETLDTLAQKIQRATGFQARVAVTTISGRRALSISPSNTQSLVQFGFGPAGKDALSGLGIPEGVIYKTTTVGGATVPADGGHTLYGLSIDSNLSLTSKDSITHALADVSTAMGIVRTAYKALVTAATPKSQIPAGAAATANGPVPAYLTAQIANYQAALTRLTGGS